jgi:hypothetical protein
MLLEALQLRAEAGGEGLPLGRRGALAGERAKLDAEAAGRDGSRYS